MKSYVKWIAGISLVAAAGGWVLAPHAEAAAPSGKAVYNQYCTCHGAKGTIPSGWKAKVKAMSAEQVENVIRKGMKGMPAFGKKLSASQSEAVAAYTKQLAAGGDPPTVSGQALYKKYCSSAGCHGAKGTSPSGWRNKVKRMSKEQVENVVRKGTKGMPAFGKNLTANQAEAVAAYTKKLVAK